MFNISAHKQTDPSKKPGQIKQDVFATKVAHGRPADVTLADYIARKQDKPKLNFDSWSQTIEKDVENIDFLYHSEVWDLLYKAWWASRENM